jgi:hypothetical protein
MTVVVVGGRGGRRVSRGLRGYGMHQHVHRRQLGGVQLPQHAQPGLEVRDPARRVEERRRVACALQLRPQSLQLAPAVPRLQMRRQPLACGVRLRRGLQVAPVSPLRERERES